ncbi:MAG: DUF6624 domain-containing protein [Nonlabens sp.]|uniref:DUF6624 domain-containing protein n=1 Tax=Nonlabens sp. TaxID=1888209 RepID=UPI003EF78023
MKIYQLLLIICVTLFMSSCKKQPELTAISYDQMVEMLENRDITIPKDVPYYSLEGKQLSGKEKIDLANDLPFADWFINKDSVLVKVQLQDSEKVRIAQKTTPLLENGSRDIDCKRLDKLLRKVYVRDQDARADNLKIAEIDESNLTIIEQVLEKCGMPTKESAGELGHSAIWLVIQHASAEKRKQYFPMLLEAAENGLLEPQDVALMQDRMLMDDGKPQLYGSQVMMNDDGTYELYELQEPERVDARRKKMGMGELNDYLSFFKIKFDVLQKD